MTPPQTQDDEALVEVMALGLLNSDCEVHGYPHRQSLGCIDDGDAAAYRRSARAALTALRNHEGRG